MSADNGYIIRKHPKGGYAAVHYFASNVEDEGWPEVEPDRHPMFSTLVAAYEYGENDWTEYGVTLHPEVRPNLADLGDLAFGPVSSPGDAS